MRKRYRHRNDRGGGILLAVITIILTAVLVLILYVNEKEEKRLTAELEEAGRVQREERYAEEARVKVLVDDVKQVFEEYLPGIVCWGDSLTAGAGGDGTTYPHVLETLIRDNVISSIDMKKVTNDGYIRSYLKPRLKVPVINMGVGGENTNTILGRNGGIPFVLSSDLQIPAGKVSVRISFESQNGRAVAPLRQGKAGMESVTIDDCEGTISIEQESYKSEEFEYYFTRNKPGTIQTAKAGTTIVTTGSQENRNYIPVIFIGQNRGYEDIEDLIYQQRAIINHQSGNPLERYIIVGLHTGTLADRAELETAMTAEYGERYINLREYMSTQGLTDAGLEATEEDMQMMENGMTPVSLLVDGVHFNAAGYELIGKLIYTRMDKLGYFSECREAIEKMELQ